VLRAIWPSERHEYSWVPTDQSPRGPCQVDPTYQKPRRPTSGPEDLIHISTTMDDHGRPYPDPGESVVLGVQDKTPGRGLAPSVGPSITRYSW
jgi:hypothetical protein